MKKQALSLNYIQNAAARAAPERAAQFAEKMTDRAANRFGGAFSATNVNAAQKAGVSANRATEAAGAAVKGMGGNFATGPAQQMTGAFKTPASGMSPNLKTGLGVGAAALGTYGLYKGIQHLRNKNQPAPQQAQQPAMPKVGSASVLSFMDEMEKISNQMGFDFGGPPQAVQTAMGAAQIPVRAAQKYIPAMARQYGTRFANWAKRQPGEIKQGLGHGVEALKNPMQAVQGGFEHKVAPLKNLANNPLTLGNAVSAGLTAHGLMQSGKQMVNAVKDKEDPTGQGKSRIARGIEAGGRLAGTLGGLYASKVLGKDLGHMGQIAAGVLPQAAGTVLGNVAGRAADRLQGHNRQAAQQRFQQQNMQQY